MQQACGESITVDVLESSGNTSLQIANALEERLELLRLVLLNLAVLNRLASERLVELNSLVGSAAILVLRRLLANPEEDVALQSVLA